MKVRIVGGGRGFSDGEALWARNCFARASWRAVAVRYGVRAERWRC